MHDSDKGVCVCYPLLYSIILIAISDVDMTIRCHEERRRRCEIPNGDLCWLGSFFMPYWDCVVYSTGNIDGIVCGDEKGQRKLTNNGLVSKSDCIEVPSNCGRKRRLMEWESWQREKEELRKEECWFILVKQFLKTDCRMCSHLLHLWGKNISMNCERLVNLLKLEKRTKTKSLVGQFHYWKKKKKKKTLA